MQFFLLVWGMARESLTATVAATKAAFQFNQLIKGSFCVLGSGDHVIDPQT